MGLPKSAESCRRTNRFAALPRAKGIALAAACTPRAANRAALSPARAAGAALGYRARQSADSSTLPRLLRTRPAALPCRMATTPISVAAYACGSSSDAADPQHAPERKLESLEPTASQLCIATTPYRYHHIDRAVASEGLQNILGSEFSET
jgi:hypothetical protein